MKRILITVAVIAALLLAVSLIVSPIAQSYIERNSRQMTGRQITLDKLSLNAFTGSVTIRNIAMMEADGKKKFVDVARLRVKLNPFPLVIGRIVVRGIEVDGANLNVYQKGESFNFDDLMERFLPEGEESGGQSPASEADWSLGVYDIKIMRSNVYYKDEQIGGEWYFNDLSLTIPEVHFSGEDTDVGIDLRLKNGGTLSAAVKFDMGTGRYTVNATLHDFSAQATLPYFQQYMNLSAVEGIISGDFTIKGNTSHLMDFNLSGKAAAKDISFSDMGGRKVMSAKNATGEIESINMAQERFVLSRLDIQGGQAEVTINEQGEMNMASLLKEEEVSAEDLIQQSLTEELPSSGIDKMTILIRNLTVYEATLLYTDLSIVRPFEYKISDIRLSARNFNPDGVNDITVSASLHNTATAEMKWRGDINDMSNQNISLVLRNIDLKDFTPYSLHYFGYPFKSGTLTFTSQNVVRDNQLTGTNKIDIYGCEVAGRDKSVKAEYKMPLKLGLYVLKDKKNRIYLDIPIGGDIESPDFSYRKIVMKSLGNTLSKVVTSPASFMAGVLGMKDDKLQSIEFDPLMREFTSEQYNKLRELAEVIKSKPELKVTLTQKLAYNQTLDEYSLYLLKKQYYLSKYPDKDDTKFDLLDHNATKTMNPKTSGLADYADRLLREKGKRARGKIEDKAVTLFEERAKEMIADDILARNTLIYSYLTAIYNVPATSIEVATEPLKNMKKYKGKNLFSIKMDFEDESTDHEMVLPDKTFVQNNENILPDSLELGKM